MGEEQAARVLANEQEAKRIVREHQVTTTYPIYQPDVLASAIALALDAAERRGREEAKITLDFEPHDK